MSNSNLSFSATLPPFYYASGYNTNFSKVSLTATGTVALSTVKDSQTGANTTAISSYINSNGLNYTENSATINGNELTINYTSGNAAQSPQNSGVAAGLLNTNINGTGISFTPQNSITSASAVTTSYGTSPNNSFNLSITNAAVSTGSSDDGQNIILKSLSVVGNSLTATYDLTASLPNNSALASSAPPAITGQVTVISPSSVNDNNNNGPSFSSSGVMTIGDLLAATTGITTNGSITGALQSAAPGLSNSSASNSILASVLNPNSNLSPSASLQVTDFVNTGFTTFVPSTPSPTSSGNSNSFTNSSSSNSGNSNNSPSGQSNTASNSNVSDTGPTGFYNAVANANASTIRGTGVNAVA